MNPEIEKIQREHEVVQRQGPYGLMSWCDKDETRQPCDTQVVLGVLEQMKSSYDSLYEQAWKDSKW